MSKTLALALAAALVVFSTDAYRHNAGIGINGSGRNIGISGQYTYTGPRGTQFGAQVGYTRGGGVSGGVRLSIPFEEDGEQRLMTVGETEALQMSEKIARADEAGLLAQTSEGRRRRRHLPHNLRAELHTAIKATAMLAKTGGLKEVLKGQEPGLIEELDDMAQAAVLMDEADLFEENKWVRNPASGLSGRIPGWTMLVKNCWLEEEEGATPNILESFEEGAAELEDLEQIILPADQLKKVCNPSLKRGFFPPPGCLRK